METIVAGRTSVTDASRHSTQPARRGVGALRVAHFQRRPYPGCYSIERVFEAVRSALQNQIVCEPVVCRYLSRGVVMRIANCVDAAFRSGDVNHITGDVHYLALVLPRRRTVLTIHDCSGMEDLSGWRRKLFRWLWLELPMARAAVVTVVSEFTKDQLLRHTSCDAGKIRIVPDPVPVGMSPMPRRFRAEQARILHMGTLPHKNLERVVEALRGVSCSLDIVGRLSPAQLQVLNESGLPFSASHGLSDAEVVEKYRMCDLVVFASLKEGFGMPIIEANAVGRPVVTSNQPPMSEVGAGAACLVDPYDVASIRQGILRVIQDERYRSTLISSGYANAARFASTVVAEEYLRIYSSLQP
jgi:glycosyltransferase involved in cell wall biosynthesis